jgi:XTP/dITP diphosphohydrolase
VRLLLATRSDPKVAEIREILGVLPELELVVPDRLGLVPEPGEDEIEVYETFEGNALAKARWFHEKTGLPTLADDSGLVVDALDGDPGVRSKRFAPDALVASVGDRDRANNLHLLERLDGVPEARRRARFVCVATLVDSDGNATHARGEVEGRILFEPVGSGGFGYDPLFRETSTGLVFGEIPRQRKSELSHRGRAFRAMRDHLVGLLPGEGEDSSR